MTSSWTGLKESSFQVSDFGEWGRVLCGAPPPKELSHALGSLF